MATTTAKLIIRREVAAREIEAQIKLGQAILDQRIRSQWDLDQARGEKQEWVHRVTQLLNRIFDSPAVAEQCNDWVGIILPEYATLDLFVDLFIDEMRHRIGRLKALFKQIDEYEELPIGAVRAAPEPEPAPAVHTPTPAAIIEPLAPPKRTGKTTQGSKTTKPATSTTTPMSSSTSTSRASNNTGLLIARLADEAARDAVLGFLTRLGLNASVVDPRGGEPILSAFTAEKRFDFALILTEGESGDSVEDAFELGCCVGRMGAERVGVLVRGNGNGEAHGVEQIACDFSNDSWQLPLARHFKRAGVAVDLNKLL